MEFEKQIITEILAGNCNQFKFLVDKYQNPVFKVILKIVGNYEDAAELTQDVFVKSYETLHQYNSNYKFFSWIYRIAINRALQFVKSKKRFAPMDEVENTTNFSLENSVDSEKGNQLINTSICKLDEKYKYIILLKYYAKLSYSQIAEILELPEATVKSRLFDARKLLKESLLKVDYFTSIQNN